MPTSASSSSGPGAAAPCGCERRAPWARIEDDVFLQMPVVESGEWEEMRACPHCGRHWFCAWPEEVHGGMFAFRPEPPDAHRLREVDRAATMRAWVMVQLEEHHGALTPQKLACKKVACERKRVRGSGYCLEHLIADRFGRHLARLDAGKPEGGKTPLPRAR